MGESSLPTDGTLGFSPGEELRLDGLAFRREPVADLFVRDAHALGHGDVEDERALTKRREACQKLVLTGQLLSETADRL